MTTITINDSTKKGKKLVEYLKTLDYVKIESETSKEVRKSVQEMKAGKRKPINQLFE